MDLQEMFGGFKSQNIFCDAVLKTGKVALNVHKSFLACKSEYFLKLFASSSNRKTQFVLEGLTEIGLDLIIKYAYSGTVIINVETLDDILNAATHLQFEDVRKECTKFMYNSINILNALWYLKLFDIYNLGEPDNIRNFILRNFSTLLESKEFNLLSQRNLLDLLSDESIHINDQLALFLALVGWIESKSNRLKTNASFNLLSKVKYESIAPSRMETVYEKDILFQPECKLLLRKIIQLGYKQNISTAGQDVNLSKDVSLKKRIVVASQNSSERLVNVQFFKVTDNSLEFETECGCRYQDALFADIRSCYNDRSIFFYIPYPPIKKSFLYELNLSTLKWSQLGSLPSFYSNSEIIFISSVHKIFLLGGFDQKDHLTKSIYSFSLEHARWTLENDYELPGVLCNFSVVSINNQMFLTGGTSKSWFYQNDLYASFPSEKTWRKLAPMNIARCSHYTSSYPEDNPTRLYVFGGDSIDKKSTAEFYDFGTCQWTLLNEVPFAYYDFNCSVVFGNKIYLIGHKNKTNMFCFVQFFPETQNWKKKETLHSPPRNFFSAYSVEF